MASGVPTIAYFDINQTIMLGDSSQGHTFEQSLQSQFAKATFADWAGDGKETDYDKYLKSTISNREERNEKLTRFVEWLPTWRDANGKEHLDHVTIKERFDRIVKRMEGQYFVPSFVNLIERCEREEKELRIVFRTFGRDLFTTVDEYRKRFPQRSVVDIGGFKGHNLHVSGKMLTTAQEIHDYVMGLKSDAAFNDDYFHWSGGKNHARYAKLFPIGNDRVFFLDDNGRPDYENYNAICPIDLETNQYVYPSSQAIQANILEAIEDPDYFYNILFKA